MTVILREIGTLEIPELRLVDPARVIKRNEWLNKMELEEVRRKNLTPRDDNENQEINDIL